MPALASPRGNGQPSKNILEQACGVGGTRPEPHSQRVQGARRPRSATGLTILLMALQRHVRHPLAALQPGLREVRFSPHDLACWSGRSHQTSSPVFLPLQPLESSRKAQKV